MDNEAALRRQQEEEARMTAPISRSEFIASLQVVVDRHTRSDGSGKGTIDGWGSFLLELIEELK